MSLVVFPFKTETPDLVVSNLATAAAHEAVEEIWAIGPETGGLTREVRDRSRSVAVSSGKPILVMAQERIGSLRPGKGDAMNTALLRAAEQSRDRVHFYDADITNFDRSWIEGAERAADRGYGVVRHRFPRAATDAMITWMITKPGFAILFPGTFLPRLNQPLGGEILLTGPAVRSLASSSLVRDRSDWGIDTILTYSTSVMGLGLYEHHVEDGKRHALYGSLDELRDMLVECLDALSSLAGMPGPSVDAIHAGDQPTPAPPDLERTVAYDVEATLALLDSGWLDGERDLADLVPGGWGSRLAERPKGGDITFMDADAWFATLGFLIDGFVLGDPVWESLAFRLWLARVLAYTTNQATADFGKAMAYLEGTIEGYERLASDSSPGSRGVDLTDPEENDGQGG